MKQLKAGIGTTYYTNKKGKEREKHTVNLILPVFKSNNMEECIEYCRKHNLKIITLESDNYDIIDGQIVKIDYVK